MASVLLMLENCIGPLFDERAHRLFKCAPHQSIAGLTARDGVAVVTETGVIREMDHALVQVVTAQHPLRQNMLVVERYGVGLGAANEATVPETNVSDESFYPEIHNVTVFVGDCVFTIPAP